MMMKIQLNLWDDVPLPPPPAAAYIQEEEKEEEEIVRDFVLKEIRKIEFGIKNREKKRK